MIVLWRDGWLKPLYDFDLGSLSCNYCKRNFAEMDFVTSCDFCQIGTMHDGCANRHIMSEHLKELKAKINSHKDKPLHDFQ
jgi:hypothetical protein